MGNSLSKVLATAALLAGSHLHHAYLGAPGSINDENQIPMNNHVFSRHLTASDAATPGANVAASLDAREPEPPPPEEEAVIPPVQKEGRSSFKPEQDDDYLKNEDNPYFKTSKEDADLFDEGWEESKDAYVQGIRARQNGAKGQAPDGPYQDGSDKTLRNNFVKGWIKENKRLLSSAHGAYNYAPIGPGPQNAEYPRVHG